MATPESENTPSDQNSNKSNTSLVSELVKILQIPALTNQPRYVFVLGALIILLIAGAVFVSSVDNSFKLITALAVIVIFAMVLLAGGKPTVVENITGEASYELVINVFHEPQGKPKTFVTGAEVTVLGAKNFKAATNAEGRVIYRYTEIEWRRYPTIKVSAKKGKLVADIHTVELDPPNQFVDIHLTAPTETTTKPAEIDINNPLMGVALNLHTPTLDSLPKETTMNAQLREQIITFLIPYMNEVGTRQAHFNSAYWEERNKILVQWDGAANVFLDRLIIALEQHGKIKDQHPLIPLLKEIKRNVGSDKQKTIDSFIAQL